MSLTIKADKSFQKDILKAQKSGMYAPRDFTCLQAIITDLTLGSDINPKHKRHCLKGNLKDFESIHVKYDWLLIFKVDAVFLNLVMLGSHVQVYKKFN